MGGLREPDGVEAYAVVELPQSSADRSEELREVMPITWVVTCDEFLA
jgi:hypothetical protein